MFTKSDGTDSTEWTGDATVYSTYKYEVSDDGSISFYDTAFPMFAHNRFTMSVNPNDGYHPGTFFLGADAVTGSDYLSAGKTVKHVFTTDVEVYQPVSDSASKTGTLAGVHVCLTLAVAACAVAACAVAAMRLRRNRTLYR